jgi:hypothetical protein
MANEVLRDHLGTRIGEIEHQSDKLVLRDRTGRRLGEYSPRDNVTRDMTGYRVGEGNLLLTLLHP